MRDSARNQYCKPAFQMLPIREINAADETFASAPDWVVNEDLRRSIESAGVTTPILVQEPVSGPLRVVCGFQRLRLASATGARTIPSLVTQEPDPRRLFDLALFENLGTRQLSDLEKARAVTKLRAELDVPEEQIISRYLPALSLRPDRFHYLRCLATARLPLAIQRSLSGLSVEVGLRLARWSREEQEFFLETIGHYRASRSNVKRFFELLDELRAQPRPRGEATSLAVIWSQSGCEALHRSSSKGNAGVFRKILEGLHRSRYPEFSGMTSRYEENLRALDFPETVRVSPPPFFEGENLTFELSVNSPRQLARVAGRLGEAAARKEMANLFDLL